jgi:hypothetical protein
MPKQIKNNAPRLQSTQFCLSRRFFPNPPLANCILHALGNPQAQDKNDKPHQKIKKLPQTFTNTKLPSKANVYDHTLHTLHGLSARHTLAQNHKNGAPVTATKYCPQFMPRKCVPRGTRGFKHHVTHRSDISSV